MPYYDVYCIWKCITIGLLHVEIYYYDEKDMVSELLYNFKLCPGQKYNKKSLFNDIYLSRHKQYHLQEVTTI